MKKEMHTWHSHEKGGAKQVQEFELNCERLSSSMSFQYISQYSQKTMRLILLIMLMEKKQKGRLKIAICTYDILQSPGE